jgi:hypothetical protein
MKRINETFTDEEFERLKNAKEKTGLNWHDFIMSLVSHNDLGA